MRLDATEKDQYNYNKIRVSPSTRLPHLLTCWDVRVSFAVT